MSDARSSTARDEAQRVSCDFCGAQVDRVRRIALDKEYERLRTPHVVRYACEPCSEQKERERKAQGS